MISKGSIGLNALKKESVDNDNNKDYVVAMKILPSGNQIICASNNGQILLIYVQ